jgi:Cys-tRNA(Pro)/Cys-tRNA(Cys) deacylase
MSKTNAIRILEANGVNHTVITYKSNDGEIDAISVAKKIGANAETVFKTLVTLGDKNGTNIFCIPANSELNLKKAAMASNNKSIEMIKVKDLFPLTGYIRGGCSPIGMKKKYPTYFDETVQLFDEIYVSAGIRGMQVRLSPFDLINLIEAKFTDLVN